MFSEPAWNLDRLLALRPEATALARRVLTDENAENSPVIWLAPPFRTLALRKQPVNKPDTAIMYIAGFSEAPLYSFTHMEEADQILSGMTPEAYREVCYDQLNLPRLHDIVIFAAPVNIEEIGVWCPFQHALYQYSSRHGLRYSVLKQKFLLPFERKQLMARRA